MHVSCICMQPLASDHKPSSVRNCAGQAHRAHFVLSIHFCQLCACKFTVHICSVLPVKPLNRRSGSGQVDDCYKSFVDKESLRRLRFVHHGTLEKSPSFVSPGGAPWPRESSCVHPWSNFGTCQEGEQVSPAHQLSFLGTCSSSCVSWGSSQRRTRSVLSSRASYQAFWTPAFHLLLCPWQPVCSLWDQGSGRVFLHVHLHQWSSYGIFGLPWGPFSQQRFPELLPMPQYCQAVNQRSLFPPTTLIERNRIRLGQLLVALSPPSQIKHAFHINFLCVVHLSM